MHLKEVKEQTRNVDQTHVTPWKPQENQTYINTEYTPESADVELDIIEEFRNNMHKLNELHARWNFMSKEINSLLIKQK